VRSVGWGAAAAGCCGAISTAAAGAALNHVLLATLLQSFLLGYGDPVVMPYTMQT
jgi:hypothetical protein